MKRFSLKLATAALVGSALVAGAPVANAVPSNLLGLIRDDVSTAVNGLGSRVLQKVSPLTPIVPGDRSFMFSPGSRTKIPVLWFDTDAAPRDRSAHTVNLSGVSGTVKYSKTGRSVDAGALLSVVDNQVQVFLPANAEPGQYQFSINLVGLTPSGVPAGGTISVDVFVPQLPIPSGVSVGIPPIFDGLFSEFSS